jgi:hypothetical protein
VAPLRLGRLRGKKSNPSIGWEVPVKSRRSESRSCMKHAGRHSEKAIRQWYALFIFGMVECIRTYAWICLFNGKVK